MPSNSIFIAFTGPEVDQSQDVVEISPGYECWNLRKFTIDSFLAALKEKIPPINDNVLNNYRAADDNPRPDFGLRQADFDLCSWGLLLPKIVPESYGGYPESLFLLNLYSPHFLYPVFYATDFGIAPTTAKKDKYLYFHNQKQKARFARTAFVNFYNELRTESLYATWDTRRMAKWHREEWRLFAACLLFSELKEYENQKQIFGWQRESADLSTILEALFTAGDDDNTEISYRLRKRFAALVGFRFPHIETYVKKLYKQRSSFVHGSFFREIQKEMKVTKSGLAELPPPEFEFLYVQKEYVRVALASYLYLYKMFRIDPQSFPDCKNVLQILEKAIIDIDSRRMIQSHVAHILDLMA